MLLTEVSHPAGAWLILPSAACTASPHSSLTGVLRRCQILCGMAQHAPKQLSLSVSVLPTCTAEPPQHQHQNSLLNPQETHMAGRAAALMCRRAPGKPSAACRCKHQQAVPRLEAHHHKDASAVSCANH